VARAHSLHKPVIAITGSVGKTTTKEMIASILTRRWRIVKTRGSFNYVKHTRSYAKQLTSAHGAAVLEYAMTHAGHIRSHCRILRPNYGVITNIGTAHIGNFGGKITGIARAKSELIRYMKQRGKLFLNADDPNSRLLATKHFSGRIFKVGLAKPAHYKAFNIRFHRNGMSFQTILQGKKYTFFIPELGKHNIYNALFAIAVCHQLKCSPSLIKKGLKSYRRLGRRMNVYRLPGGIRLLDDTYSANPQSMKAALDVLAKMGRGTKIAVLGSMLEMGKYSARGHRNVGRYVAHKKIDYLYTYGKSGRQIGLAAVKAGFPSSKVKHVNSKQLLPRKVSPHLRPGATILLKGSNKLEMNTIVYGIKKAQRKR